MKKIIFSFLLLLLTFFISVPGQAATPKTWTADAPQGFTALTWAKARGISSFYKAQSTNGYLDYITVVYLPYAQVKLITPAVPEVGWGIARSPFDTIALPALSNWAFSRAVTEQVKSQHPDAQFFWNMPYFNITGSTTDLSLALKSIHNGNPYITSGSRPEVDVAENRRMLIVDNKSATAAISDFDAAAFVDRGDQAVEGFAPSVSIKADGSITSRLFVGVRAAGKELVIYCSRGATADEASNALVAAGVPSENQLQVDGGASATCAYNMPGQYFVEPGRMLPHLMAAYPFYPSGTIDAARVNVRSGPGLTNKVVKQLLKGASVKIYEEQGDWLRIDESSQWIFKPLVKRN